MRKDDRRQRERHTGQTVQENMITSEMTLSLSLSLSAADFFIGSGIQGDSNEQNLKNKIPKKVSWFSVLNKTIETV